MFCTTGFSPREERPTQTYDSIDIPDGILDDAPLAVILGGVAWFAACLWSCGEDSDNKHNKGWHHWFRRIVENFSETFTDFPFPKLPTQGSAFCIELAEEFGDKEPKYILEIFATVAIFLRNKNVVTVLQCCRRCQILFTQFSWGTTLSTSINESPVNTDASGTTYPIYHRRIL